MTSMVLLGFDFNMQYLFQVLMYDFILFTMINLFCPTLISSEVNCYTESNCG